MKNFFSILARPNVGDDKTTHENGCASKTTFPYFNSALFRREKTSKKIVSYAMYTWAAKKSKSHLKLIHKHFFLRTDEY